MTWQHNEWLDPPVDQYGRSSRAQVWIRGGPRNTVSAFDPYALLGNSATDAGLAGADGEAEELQVIDNHNPTDLITVDEQPGLPERQTLTVTEVSTLTQQSAHWNEKRRNGTKLSVMLKIGGNDSLDPGSFDSAQICDDVIPRSYASFSAGLHGIGDDSRSQDNRDPAELGYGSNSWSDFITQQFSDVAVAEVTKAINDVAVFRDRAERTYYALEAFATGSAMAKIVAIDPYGVVQSADITELTNTQDAIALGIMGGKLVVISNDAGSHVSIDRESLAVGNYTGSEITGYLTGKEPNDIYVRSAGQAFVAGDGGYIYRLTGPSAAPTIAHAGTVTTQNLTVIHGIGNIILAGGAANALIYSTDGGSSWKAITITGGAGAAISAICCSTQTDWYVGYNNGKLFYTYNAGVTWRESVHGTGISNIKDIVFDRRLPSCGWIAGVANSKSAIARTHSQGNQWYNTESFFKAQPGGTIINAIASAGNVNTLLVGGGATSDGLLALGQRDD